MSDDYREARLRFAYINPDLPIENPRVLKDLRFEYLIPEFKLPSEEDPVMEHEWAMIRMLFAGPRLIDDEKVKADTKGNETMDEEFFNEETIARLTMPEGASPRNSEYYKSLVVDIETYTNHALKLQMAFIEAETQLENARQKHREVESHLNDLAKQRREAAIAVKNARAELQEHLDIVRKTHVTLREGRHV